MQGSSLNKRRGSFTEQSLEFRLARDGHASRHFSTATGMFRRTVGPCPCRDRPDDSVSWQNTAIRPWQAVFPGASPGTDRLDNGE